VLRMPMVPVGDATRKRLEGLVSELGLIEPVAAKGHHRQAS
jgi:hypothetical protein